MYGGFATTTSYRLLSGSSSVCKRFSFSAANSPKIVVSPARDARSLAGCLYRENSVESRSVAADPSAIGKACA